MSRGERKAMITRDAPELSLSRQCRLLSIGRSSFYYAPRGESPSSLALMRRIDELFMKYPFYGSRQMVRQLRRDGVCVGRHRVRRLMRLIGLEAIYQAPRTSVPHPMHRIYPYLLKGMAIDQPNRVWCADITYIPVQRGFLYLVAIMDWATRHVLSWRLSNTMDAGFCAEALGDALARYGQPEIFNTDQGSQFTSLDFTGVLKNASIRISRELRCIPPDTTTEEYEMIGQGAKVYSTGIRSNTDDESTPVYGGIQGPGGAGSAAGRQDDPADRGQAQGASEPGERLEAPGGGRSGRSVFERRQPRLPGS